MTSTLDDARNWNADCWHLFLCQHCDNRATSPHGMNTVALKIADTMDALRAAPDRCDAGSAPLLLPTPEQIEPILDDFLGVDSPHYEELRKRCAQRIFDLCVVMSGVPITKSDNRISPVSSANCGGET